MEAFWILWDGNIGKRQPRPRDDVINWPNTFKDITEDIFWAGAAECVWRIEELRTRTSWDQLRGLTIVVGLRKILYSPQSTLRK